MAIRILAFLFFLTAGLAPPLARAGQGLIVGGPCRYDIFPGKATIVSVEPASAKAAAHMPQTPYPPLAVTFAFSPDAPIVGEPLYVPNIPVGLTLLNGMPPGPRFVAKYGLAPGTVVPCQWHRIRQGTCTPALYVFPGIDTADYFELTGR